MTSAAPIPVINYDLNDDTKKAIEEYATLVANTHRAKCNVMQPAMNAGLLNSQCEAHKKQAIATMTGRMQRTLVQMNTVIREQAARGDVIELEIGNTQIMLDSPANVNRALRTLISDRFTPAVRNEKTYYDKRLETVAKLREREAGIRSGRMSHFSDLDIARLGDLNNAIVEAGEAIGISRSQLAVDKHRYELRIYESRLKSKTNPSSYEERSITDDSRRVALVRQWLGRDEIALAAEHKRAAESALAAKEKSSGERRTPPVRSTIPTAPAIPETLPAPMAITPRDLPPMTPPPMMPSSLIDSAREQVQGILSGSAASQADFNLLPHMRTQKRAAR